MCTRAHTQREMLQETTKWGMLIGQMGSFFYVHALASISISTEDHSCESSPVYAHNTHTHLHNSVWHSGLFTNKHESVLWRCGAVYSPPSAERRVNRAGEREEETANMRKMSREYDHKTSATNFCRPYTKETDFLASDCSTNSLLFPLFWLRVCFFHVSCARRLSSTKRVGRVY